jgi:hypothetical protein
MSFDLQKLLESKRALRRQLTTRPIEEKLRLLDALRERELAIRGGVSSDAASGILREEPARHRPKPKSD